MYDSSTFGGMGEPTHDASDAFLNHAVLTPVIDISSNNDTRGKHFISNLKRTNIGLLKAGMITVAFDVSKNVTETEFTQWSDVLNIAATVQIVAIDSGCLTCVCLHSKIKEIPDNFSTLSQPEKEALPLFMPIGRVLINTHPRNVIEALFIVTNGGLTNFSPQVRSEFAKIEGYIPTMVGAPFLPHLPLATPLVPAASGSLTNTAVAGQAILDPLRSNVIQVTAGGLSAESSLKAASNLSELNPLHRLFDLNKNLMANLMGPQFDFKSQMAKMNLSYRLATEVSIHNLPIVHPNFAEVLLKCVFDSQWCKHLGDFTTASFTNLHPCMFIQGDLAHGALLIPTTAAGAARMFRNIAVVLNAVITPSTPQEFLQKNIMLKDQDMTSNQSVANTPLGKFFDLWGNFFEWQGQGGIDRGPFDYKSAQHIAVAIYYATTCLQISWKEFVKEDLFSTHENLDKILTHIGDTIAKPMFHTTIFQQWLNMHEVTLISSGMIPLETESLRQDFPRTVVVASSSSSSTTQSAATIKAAADRKRRLLQLQQNQLDKAKKAKAAQQQASSSAVTATSSNLPNASGFGSTVSAGASVSGLGPRINGVNGLCFQNTGNILCPEKFSTPCNKPNCAFASTHFTSVDEIPTAALHKRKIQTFLLKMTGPAKSAIIAKAKQVYETRSDRTQID